MRYLFLMLFLCSAAVVCAQPYFCTDELTDLVYVRRYVDDLEVKWVHTMSIRTVSMAADSSRNVEYSSFIDMRAGKSMREPAGMKALVSPDGDVTLDIASSMVAVLEGVLWKKAEVTAEGGIALLPSEMMPGDTLPDASGKVHALGMTMNVSVTERKVIGEDTLDTPAGTFDCIVISEHKVEKGMFRNRTTTALTWYAKGIGMVRHDTYDRNMVLETSEILEKIIKKNDVHATFQAE